MIPKCRIYCYETQEMIVARDYRELAELFAGLDADDSLYSDPMQSTGLFDKNGKEIFEGDVIRVNYTDDDSPWTDAIIWSPKDCAWYLKSNKELLGFAMDEPDIIVEVIGNIYENPELVEEK